MSCSCWFVELAKASRRGAKARLSIEAFQRGFVVDVEPLYTSSLHGGRRTPYELEAYAAALEFRMNSGIEKECVIAAVPRDVHEADQARIRKGTDICQASCKHLSEVAMWAIWPRTREELAQRLSGQRRTILVTNAGQWRQGWMYSPRFVHHGPSRITVRPSRRTDIEHVLVICGLLTIADHPMVSAVMEYLGHPPVSVETPSAVTSVVKRPCCA